MYHGKVFTANAWGMRDRAYPLERTAGTYRIALLGASHVMGHGVADDEVFEAVLEERLHTEGLAGLDQEFEIMNFSVDGYTAVQQPWVLEERVLAFRPHAVFYVAHASEFRWVAIRLARKTVEGLDMPSPYLRGVLEEQGVEPTQTYREIVRRLQPRSAEILSWSYRRMVSICRDNGILPVWVFMPRLSEQGTQAAIPRVHTLARESGFEVLSMARIFKGRKTHNLRVSSADYHPNAEGHRMVAAALYDRMAERSDLFSLTSESSDTEQGAGHDR